MTKIIIHTVNYFNKTTQNQLHSFFKGNYYIHSKYYLILVTHFHFRGHINPDNKSKQSDGAPKDFHNQDLDE